MKSLFVFFFFLFVLTNSGLSEKCNPSDKKALFQIKQAFNNTYGHLASWTKDTDCCDWYCVSCHPKTHRIKSLEIFEGNISGQIPAAVGDLPHLETLVFRKLPNLSGAIHPSIANLTKLSILSLSYTDLSGPIPAFLGSLKSLTLLELSHNKLTGSIPATLTALRKMNTLDVSFNQLCGKIPVGGRLQTMDKMYYYNNKCLCGAPLKACK